MKVRITEVASEAAKNTQDVLDACAQLGINVKSASSTLSDDQAGKVLEHLINGVKVSAKKQPAPTQEKKEEAKEKTKESPRKQRAATKTQEQAKESKKDTPHEKKEEDSKKKEEPKKEERQATKEPVRLARRKLTIVKKKNPHKAKPEESSRKKRTNTDSKTISFDEVELGEGSYGKKNVTADMTEEERHKKQKSKKQSSSGKKESGVKLDLLNNRDLIEYDEKEEVIFMPDLSMPTPSNLDNSRPTKPKRNDPNAINQNQRPIGRGGKRRSAQKSISRGVKKKKQPKRPSEPEVITSVTIPEDVRVYEFADLIGKNAGEVIKVLFGLGMMVTKNDFLEKDSIEILAEEFGVEVKTKNMMDDLDYVAVYDESYSEFSEERPPIVTIMGHVDHGKTSLLDYIRTAKVAAGEAGGITQHIGAYTIEKNDKKITFIDTPGHEAFSEMRARGASATDVVIIVVAADDGVMPQTKEAISHAKASGAPLIVAINKIDKPNANVDVVKGQLSEVGITPVDWGGEYDAIGVSAQTGEGVDELLETILIQSELLELQASSQDPAKAVVVESSLEKGRGAVATVIVQNGTLSVGDTVLVGTTHGRIRAIMNEKGNQVKTLGPSEAGEILGLNSSPMSGEILVSMNDEKEIRELAQKREEHQRQRELSKSTKATLDDLHSLIAEGKLKSLRIILKADVQGTLEAIVSSLSKLRNDEVKVDIVHSAVGAISESDVTLASASDHTVILGFHVKPSTAIKDKAKSVGVEIKTYNVIYDMIDDVKKTLGGMLSPITKEEKSGSAEVREVYDISSLGRIAGCMVTGGEMVRGAIAVVYRNENEIYRGRLESLKRFKDDVKEVRKGFECGIGLQDFDETQPGDIIECIKEVEVEAEFKNS